PPAPQGRRPGRRVRGADGSRRRIHLRGSNVRAPTLVMRLIALEVARAAAIIAVFAVSTVWLAGRALERQEAAYLSESASLVAQSLDREWREGSDLKRAAAATLGQ